MSDSTVAEQIWTLPGALWQLRSEACGLLTALNERVWQNGDPILLELVRVRVAQLIGNPAAARARCALAVGGAEAKLAALPDYPFRRCSLRRNETWYPSPSSSSSTWAGQPRTCARS